ncbi:MAG: hypothetical protein JNK25_02545 [Phycisphaerae bacterium]|nr:hypothetical protein [Phycisphaerae bacterium]
MRHGFALPIVLLLVLVAGIMVAVMMERQTAQAMIVRRELDSYTFHHVSQGVQEAVEAWLRKSGAGRAMAENIKPDGHAFDLTLDDGQNVRISFFDAQDKALVELAGLSAQAREAARLVLQELRARAGANAGALVRRDGPLPISVNSAPPDVLYSAINSVTEGDGTAQIVGEILHARGGQPLDGQMLNEILNQSTLEPEARNRLNMVITATPTLWRVLAEAQTPAGLPGGISARRYCGLVLLTNAVPGGSRDTRTALQRNSSIISWEDCSEQDRP